MSMFAHRATTMDMAENMMTRVTKPMKTTTIITQTGIVSVQCKGWISFILSSL